MNNHSSKRNVGINDTVYTKKAVRGRGKKKNRTYNSGKKCSRGSQHSNDRAKSMQYIDYTFSL